VPHNPQIFRLLAAALPLAACMDSGISACHDSLELGILSPAPNDHFAQGFPIPVTANVRSTCGIDLESEGFFVLTSTEEGELGGSWRLDEGQVTFETDALLRLGDHLLTLRGVTSDGSSGEDTVSITIVENEAPTVDLTTPDELGADFSEAEGAHIRGWVHDNAEPLASLRLSWTINGEDYAGPEHADKNGEIDFVAQVPGGCHSISVTVTDALDQSAADNGDFVLWQESSDMNSYLWWSDEDGDGWGIPQGEILSCTAPEGAVAFTVEQDCNDENDAIYPGHADYCGDGVDSDCDPITPTGCFPWGDVGAEYANASLEGSSIKLSRTGDINDDGHDDFAVAMADLSTQIVFGPVLGDIVANAILVSESTTNFYYLTGYLGQGMSGGKDVDGDGVPDLLLGNPDWTWACSSNSNSHSGRAYLLRGGALADNTMEDILESAADWAPGGALSLHTDFENGCNSYFSKVGYSVEILDDMDGDGKPDLAIGATTAATLDSGAVYIVLSGALALLQSGDTLEDIYHLRLAGPTDQANLGTAMGSADLDGDGLSDLIVAASPDSHAIPGTIYVVFGTDLPVSPAQMDIRAIAGLSFSGVNTGDQLGADIVGMGDLDGDGDEEFMVTAPGAQGGQGVAYLVPGFYEVFGTYAIEDSFSTAVTPNATSAVRFMGGPSDAVRSVGGVGDLNNDGEVDLLIGAPGHQNGSYTQAGAAYVLYGGAAFWGDWWDESTGDSRSDISLPDAAAVGQYTAKISPSIQGEELGWDVDWAGDLNGDGIDDILLGAHGPNGVVRVFFGGGT
jgi:hypothetical protein